MALIKYTLLFLFCVVNTQFAHALMVKDVRIGQKSDHVRIVLDLDAPVQYKLFTLSNPHRVVMDMPALDWRTQFRNTLGQSLVQNIRHGKYNETTSRIVVDLNTPATVQKHFMLSPDQYGSHRLVLDIKPAANVEYRLAPNNSPVSRIQNATPQKSEPLKTSVTLDTGETLVFSETTRANPPHIPPIMIADNDHPIPETKPYKKGESGREKPLIIIDPGHGGVDPGAIASNKVFEKNIVLKLAQNLKMKLDATGRYRVKLTRTDDRFIKLRDRVKFARKHNADLFISLHADSLDHKDTHGSSVYTLSDKASDKESAQLAARENRVDLIGGVDLNVEDEDVASILVDLAMRDTQNHSNYLANTVVAKFKSGRIKTLRTAHRSAGFAVLKAPDIPSILVEAGFLSNPQEAERLNTPAYRSEIALALTQAVNTFFEARIAAE